MYKLPRSALRSRGLGPIRDHEGAYRYVAVDALLARYRAEHPVQDIVNRLRCGAPRCGQPPSAVRLRSRLEHEPGPPIREVILTGPGAF